MEKAATITCERCRVTVPVAALSMPDRCTDQQCPLRQLQQEKAA